MLKSLIKFFIPSDDKLAKTAASKIAGLVNAQNSDREAQIAKIASVVQAFTKYQDMTARILADGKIEPDEEAEIAASIEPAIAYLKGLI